MIKIFQQEKNDVNNFWGGNSCLVNYTIFNLSNHLWNSTNFKIILIMEGKKIKKCVEKSSTSPKMPKSGGGEGSKLSFTECFWKKWVKKFLNNLLNFHFNEGFDQKQAMKKSNAIRRKFKQLLNVPQLRLIALHLHLFQPRIVLKCLDLFMNSVLFPTTLKNIKVEWTSTLIPNLLLDVQQHLAFHHVLKEFLKNHD